ncbi:MAG: hypothetical protein FJ218_09875 [Ignavibacteria bacterium]|nr:hypothetical protein [Ignavibacteria bacterium]
MTTTILEIEKQLETMPEQTQMQVLDYVKSILTPIPKGIPGKNLAPFFGVLSDEDAREMIQAIEEGCENIYPNEW